MTLGNNTSERLACSACHMSDSCKGICGALGEIRKPISAFQQLRQRAMDILQKCYGPDEEPEDIPGTTANPQVVLAGTNISDNEL